MTKKYSFLIAVVLGVLAAAPSPVTQTSITGSGATVLANSPTLGNIGVNGAASANAYINLNGATPNTDYGANGIDVGYFSGHATTNSSYTPLFLNAPTGSLPYYVLSINGVRKYEFGMSTASVLQLYKEGSGFLFTNSTGQDIDFASSISVPNKIFLASTSGPLITSGSGTPEGVVTAPVGSHFLRTNGGAGTTFYVKESGAGNTGWIAK